MTHTPGPWECWAWTTQDELEAGQSAYVVTAPKASDLIAEHHANARLIAAAPDLLEALEDLLAVYVNFESSVYQPVAGDKARAAIRKAKGEA